MKEKTTLSEASLQSASHRVIQLSHSNHWR